MGDKRSHRDRGHRRGEDDPSEERFPADHRPPRRYEQPRRLEGAPPVQGLVKWFDTSKGFGFVSLEAGGEAFIHISRIKPLGYGELLEGSPITVRLGPGKKGPEVVEVIEVGAAPTSGVVVQGPRLRAGPQSMEEVDATGVVKWFNPGKGFGFVAIGDRQKDVFVSARALERAGLSELREGQRVRMKVVVNQKGPEARSISIIE